MANDAPIQFKGTTLKIIQTQLRSADPATLHTALAELTGNNADFFEHELALLDFSLTDPLPERIDWAALCALLKRSGLHAIATRGLSPELAASGCAAGLPTANEGDMGRPARPRVAESVPEVPPIPAAAPIAPPPTVPEPPPRTVILDKPLRSGQRFYARGSDLIVTAMVSAGAEVIADGNIHVYAPLRGRALAGASGDRTARIFTTCLQAELVSVAGLYRTFEAGVPAELAGQPASVALIDDAGEGRLHVAPLALR
ncbi:septum site-determining protein MinC [Azonexus sp.]|jgi:septum site-determining protein MinC|uniref:septum site-determining protein MinC n=1 Tax=Azonexus sp. TaxID=1872668 RepID=UPI00283145F4|nr:septum site-determining protein MinC [Azonexus sp.]MDR1995315.1 septum site-determining protein MinC [Azonexus sp.]